MNARPPYLRKGSFGDQRAGTGNGELCRNGGALLSVLRVRRATVVRHALSDAGGTSVQTHTSLSLSLQCFPSLLVLKVFVCLMATDEKLLVAFNLPIHCKCNGLLFLL